MLIIFFIFCLISLYIFFIIKVNVKNEKPLLKIPLIKNGLIIFSNNSKVQFYILEPFKFLPIPDNYLYRTNDLDFYLKSMISEFQTSSLSRNFHQSLIMLVHDDHVEIHVQIKSNFNETNWFQKTYTVSIEEWNKFLDRVSITRKSQKAILNRSNDWRRNGF